jgi:hypothetical protein
LKLLHKVPIPSHRQQAADILDISAGGPAGPTFAGFILYLLASLGITYIHFLEINFDNTLLKINQF